MPNFLPEDQWKETIQRNAVDDYLYQLSLEHAKRVAECLKALSSNPTEEWK